MMMRFTRSNDSKICMILIEVLFSKRYKKNICRDLPGVVLELMADELTIRGKF